MCSLIHYKRIISFCLQGEGMPVVRDGKLSGAENMNAHHVVLMDQKAEASVAAPLARPSKKSKRRNSGRFGFSSCKQS